MIVYAIIDIRSSSDHPLGDAVETFVRREDAERYIEKVRGDGPDLASYLRIEERVGGTSCRRGDFPRTRERPLGGGRSEGKNWGIGYLGLRRPRAVRPPSCEGLHRNAQLARRRS